MHNVGVCTVIVTLAPLQIRTLEQISNQCYCRLRHRISPQYLVFHCRCNRFCRLAGCIQLLQMVRTPTLCIPDTSDRPGYFLLISLSNLATSLITYGAPCITLLCSAFIATLLPI